ncbi:MAG: ABC transporter ATP-binding protein [Chloroflexota bacterium]
MSSPATKTSPAIEARGLTKRYDGFVAVDHLDLAIERGEVFGFLGPNGSGKTTTILMWLGLTEPSGGVARVWGHNSTREPLQVKRIAGYVPENVGFYDDLSARHNLLYTARLNRMPGHQADAAIERALDYVGLKEVVSKKVGQFSRGMRQRLAIADIVVKAPRVVFLDEPTLGLDQEGISRVLELIQRLSQEQGITVVVSSHQLHQVQQVCHRVGIMSRGRLVAQGTVEELARSLGTTQGLAVEIEVEGRDEALLAALRQVPGVEAVEAADRFISVRCQPSTRPRLARAVLDRGGLLVQMRSKDLTLEEIYLRYFTGGEGE